MESKKKKQLGWKVKESKRVVRAAYKKYRDKMAVAWTGGKDSTLLLHLTKEIFGEVPFPALYLNTGLEFKEVTDFINKIKKEWSVDVREMKLTRKMKKDYQSLDSKSEKGEFIRHLKIKLLKRGVKKNDLEALIAGIRWDEHKSRSGESYFSPRKNHTRVHPILHFTEGDVWEYINTYNVPYVKLYDQGYRSLGEKDFTKPVTNDESSERAGREKDKEQVMERLRALGYF